MKKLNFLVIFTLLTLTSSLFAADKVVVNMYDQILRGHNVLDLKRLARQSTSGINLRAQLEKVRLVAKSKQGHGTAVLEVGYGHSYTETISGNPYNFQSSQAATFDRIDLDVFGSSAGNWMLRLNGTIKVKKIVLFFKETMGSEVERVMIDMYGQHLQGANTLKLKQMLQRERPYLALRNFKIKKVVMMAKSKQGQAKATLMIGGQASFPMRIQGTPFAFQRNGANTFHQVVLQNNTNGNDSGAWQIKLNGNIKIDTIKIVLEPLRSRTIVRR